MYHSTNPGEFLNLAAAGALSVNGGGAHAGR
jgi:hypothetical protein